MIPAFKAALFDMDGTLLHSMRYWRVSALEYLMQHDVFPSDEQLSRLFHMSGRRLCAEIMHGLGIEIDEMEILSDMEDIMEHHYRYDTKPKANVGDYLQFLSDRDIPMAIATSSPHKLAELALGRCELLEYFRFIADDYEYEITKRDPEFFVRMAERLGVSTKDLCVFEDSLYAVESAKAAGCSVIAIYDFMQCEQRQGVRERADLFVQDYRELLTLSGASIIE